MFYNLILYVICVIYFLTSPDNSAVMNNGNPDEPSVKNCFNYNHYEQ